MKKASVSPVVDLASQTPPPRQYYHQLLEYMLEIPKFMDVCFSLFKKCIFKYLGGHFILL